MITNSIDNNQCDNLLMTCQTRADPAAGKGGLKLLTDDGGSCVEKFCISELNLCDLVHTFCQHYID